MGVGLSLCTAIGFLSVIIRVEIISDCLVEDFMNSKYSFVKPFEERYLLLQTQYKSATLSTTFNLDEESSLLATDARLFNPSFFHLCLNNEVLSVLVIICPLLLSYRKMFRPASRLVSVVPPARFSSHWKRQIHSTSSS